MLRPQVETHDEFSSWALGWQVERTGVFHHGGYNTGSILIPSAQSNTDQVVIMTNGEGGGQ